MFYKQIKYTDCFKLVKIFLFADWIFLPRPDDSHVVIASMWKLMFFSRSNIFPNAECRLGFVIALNLVYIANAGSARVSGCKPRFQGAFFLTKGAVKGGFMNKGPKGTWVLIFREMTVFFVSNLSKTTYQTFQNFQPVHRLSYFFYQEYKTSMKKSQLTGYKISRVSRISGGPQKRRDNRFVRFFMWDFLLSYHLSNTPIMQCKQTRM